mmetsp:Transcript_35241/g.51776  ORF Transcript_35241/g.51776 Transcript_35241/m.51776 type:complete len:99 (-) Transcript_35241:847-1143(-)
MQLQNVVRNITEFRLSPRMWTAPRCRENDRDDTNTAKVPKSCMTAEAQCPAPDNNSFYYSYNSRCCHLTMSRLWMSMNHPVGGSERDEGANPKVSFQE